MPRLFMNVGKLFILLLTFTFSASAFALDNPDAPARIPQFLLKAKPYEEKLAGTSNQPQFGIAAGAYAAFLDAELNRAYADLLQHLDVPSRQALVRSQRDWLAYRDSEFFFVDSNWSSVHFGDSSKVSRADYRSSVVKQRIMTLLQYLQNYLD